ncbi:MAG TPA: LuxR C-terminal-related transcriptional regulator, partial [Clostridia bacterium]|nr:LuxR C-terminal-related transcriptional regulator [Clostridia bacterium]
RRNYVVRKALYDKLMQCADMGVIFVRGGAGTGKTTLLSSFIRETGLKNVGWLSLDASNTNVYSFWLYFTAAVNTFLEDDDGFLTLMRSNMDASHMESLLTILINRLCGEQDYYLVLDDVHCLNDAALIRTFEYFISAMPENFHLFMLSREEPPVYLGTLAVSGRLLFIDGRQMQLSPEEGLTFLKQTMRMTGSDEELNTLNTYAEGWIGGLQLAAAAEAAGKHSGELLRAGGGIAAEYLTREIYGALTQNEQDFLIGTGFLSYFDAELCTHLFDGFTKAQFDEMIETLIKKNLFIICIDEQNGVYRYHNILSEYLTHRFLGITPEDRKIYYARAAKAFEQRGDCEEALRQYCAADDYENVLRVAQSMGGKIEAWSYLDKVPADQLIQDADLAAQSFLYNLGNLNVERCRVLYEKFKEYYGDSDVFKIMQFAEAYVSSGEAILPEYHALTAEQIDGLSFGPVAKAMILVENSAALEERMQYEEAKNCLDRAIQVCAGTNAFVDFFAYNQMAQLNEELGRLNDSLACYERSKEMFKSPSMMSGIGTNFYFGIAGVYMRRMELDKAAETLEQSRRLLEEQRIHVDITDMTLTYHLAEMKFLSGDAESGASYVNEILSEYPAFNVINLGRLIHELDCAGLLPTELADEFLKEIEKASNYKGQPFFRLLRARILFEHGDTAEAFKETEYVLTFSRAHKNQLRLVEAGLLKIFMLLRCSETASGHRETSNLLREAVYYAHKDRILMPFYLDRAVLLPLLRGLITQSAGKSFMSVAEITFVRDAIALCDNTVTAARKPETLSARELEVLGELAKGITNREIAEKLCISQATVKTHLLSVFGKLGVTSRVMAVKVGQKKGLIL